MLSYEKFKELVTERLTELVKQDYPDIEIKENRVAGHNFVEETLLFSRHHDGMGVSPTLHFSKMYSAYVRNEDFDFHINQCYLTLCERLEYTEEVRKALNDQSPLDHRITFELIHTEQNKEFLSDVPHREFQDLSIIYNCSFRTENIEGRAYVTNRLAESLDVTEEELYALAYENTKRVHKPIIRPLEDVMLYTMFKEHEGINLEEIPERNGTPLLPIYMLTNCEEKRGAVSMLYPEELQKLAEKLDSDLYILPASVDMVLVTNTQDHTPEGLAQIVYEMNCEVLALEERLSNQVYHYNRQTQEISLATNTGHTMLSNEPDVPESDVEQEEEEGMSMGMGV